MDQPNASSQKLQIQWQRRKSAAVDAEARIVRGNLRASGWYEKFGITDNMKEKDESAEKGEPK